MDAKAAFKVTGCDLGHAVEAVFSFDLKGRAETVKNLTTFAIHYEKIITNLFAKFKDFLQRTWGMCLHPAACSLLPAASGLFFYAKKTALFAHDNVRRPVR